MADERRNPDRDNTVAEIVADAMKADVIAIETVAEIVLATVVEFEAVIAAYGHGDECGIAEATVADDSVMQIEVTLRVILRDG